MKPSPPQAMRLLVSDTTNEALAPILQANPRGVTLSRDELAGWLGGFDRYTKGGQGGADAARWLSIHGAESITIDRKTDGTTHVRRPAVSIAGGIQPERLRAVVTHLHPLRASDVERRWRGAGQYAAAGRCKHCYAKPLRWYPSSLRVWPTYGVRPPG